MSCGKGLPTLANAGVGDGVNMERELRASPVFVPAPHLNIIHRMKRFC